MLSHVKELSESGRPPVPQLTRPQLLDLQHAQPRLPVLHADVSTVTTWLPGGAPARVHCTRRQPAPPWR